MVKKEKIDTRQRVNVQLIIEIDGSFVQNKIAYFELPINQLNIGTKEEPGQISFETSELKKAIFEAVRNL